MDCNTTSKRGRGINRRGFLRAAAGLGAVTSISGCSSTSDTNIVRYPKIVSGDRVIQWMSVPKDWDRHRKSVKKIYNRVREWLHSISGVVGTTLVRSDRTYGDHNGFRIKIIVESDAQSGLDIPAEIDGIQIITETSPEWWGHADCSINTGNCTNREQSDKVGGGEVVGWVNGGYGTATCRVTVNGRQRLLHCSHVFWNDCTDASNGDVTGRVAAAWNERIGTVEATNIHGDYSTIDDQYGGDYVTTIDDNHTFPDMVGYVTDVACEYWSTLPRSSRPCLYKMGATTGLTTGTIIGTQSSFTMPGCTTMENEGIYTDCTAGEGDSGGPTFFLYDGDAYLVNVISYFYFGTRTGCNGARIGINSSGIAAWWIANNTAISFNSD
jgi:hypothetical protein